MNQAFAHVGMRHAYIESDQVGMKIWSSIVNDKNPFEKQQMSVEDAVALEQESNSGRSSWNKIRKSVKHAITIPSRKLTDPYKRQLYPDIHSFGTNINPGKRFLLEHTLT